MLRFRAVNRDTFDAIKTGKKKVETRAVTARYHDIRVGDTILFVCGKQRFKRAVRRVRTLKTISSLLERYAVQDINPYLKDKAELVKMYHSFPGYKEKIKKHGLIALELR